MQIRARKLVIFAVAAALAVANGFAPRHAQAAHPQAKTSAIAGHHKHDTATTGSAHHHGQKLAAVPGHDHASGNPDPDSTLYNCCVASCSALALIFASASFEQLVPDIGYHLPLASISMQAALNSADPPPR